MLNRKAIALAIVVGGSAFVPLAASAASAYHFAPNEAGVTYVPEHDRMDKTRAQVTAELESATKQPGWNSASRGAPWPVTKTGPGKTSDQVYKETLEAMRSGSIPSGER